MAGRRGPDPRVRGAEDGEASNILALKGAGDVRFLGATWTVDVVTICGGGGGRDAAVRGLRRVAAPSATAARRGEGASSIPPSSSPSPPRGEEALGKVRDEGVGGISGRRMVLFCRSVVVLGGATLGPALVAA